MASERYTSPNPFVEHQPAILIAASAIYRADRDGLEPNPDLSRVNMLPQNIGSVAMENPEVALYRAEVVQAEVDVAARAVARLALLKDTIDVGGLKGAAARLELMITSVMKRKYTSDALEAGLPDRVRGKEWKTAKPAKR